MDLTPDFIIRFSLLSSFLTVKPHSSLIAFPTEYFGKRENMNNVKTDCKSQFSSLPDVLSNLVTNESQGLLFMVSVRDCFVVEVK